MSKDTLPFDERFRREFREWSDDPFENSPFEFFPIWMFAWGETNRCPNCYRLAWYATRGEDGGIRCPNCDRSLPERWFV